MVHVFRNEDIAFGGGVLIADGGGDGGMSEASLDVADCRAGGCGGEGAGGVAEVMEAQRFEPGGTDGVSPDTPPKVAVLEGAAVGSGEDECVGLGAGPGGEVSVERVSDDDRNRDRAKTRRRLWYDELRLAVDALELAFDRDRSVQQVDVAARQPGELAETEAAPRGDQNQRPVLVGNGGGEVGDLGGGVGRRRAACMVS